MTDKIKRWCKVREEDGYCLNYAHKFGYCRKHYIKRIKWLRGGLITIVIWIVLELFIPITIGGWLNNLIWPKERLGGIIFERGIMEPEIKFKYSVGLDGKPGYFVTHEIPSSLSSCIIGKLIPANELCTLSYRISEDGEFLLTAKLYDIEGLPVTIIKDNYLIDIDPNNYKYNYDDRGMEIVDKHLNVIFSLNLLNSTTVEMRGILKYGNSRMIIRGDSTMLLQSDDVEKNYGYWASIPRLFEYTGEDWKGKRISE
ncbi:MAG: hypothetical protein NXH86_10375 [Flavobacteriaceae bacterium]|uniref:hypothetical protein n=1 Tax=Flagellimonas TaxID=444459 RepID=UPI003BAD7649|nr:hypothetical protein [Flavobacteriaceae bacterium]